MKKSKKVLKLSLNKFAVARVQNLQSISGGDGQDKTTNSRHCSDAEHDPLCPVSN